MVFKPHDRNVTHGWAPKSEPGKEAGPKACAACRGPITPPGEALQAHWPRLGAAGPGVGPASASVGVLRGGPRPSREPDSHPGGVGSTCKDRLAHKLGPKPTLAVPKAQESGLRTRSWTGGELCLVSPCAARRPCRGVAGH